MRHFYIIFVVAVQSQNLARADVSTNRQAQATTSTVDLCDKQFEFATVDDAFTIDSIPNYTYPNSGCKYTIYNKLAGDHLVQLKNLELSIDYFSSYFDVLLKDSGELHGYSPQRGADVVIGATKSYNTSCMEITFHTVPPFGKNNFRIALSLVRTPPAFDNCGGNITLKDVSDVHPIKSSGYPANYPDRARCLYHVTNQQAAAGFHVVFGFADFQTESTQFGKDYFQVGNGTQYAGPKSQAVGNWSTASLGPTVDASFTSDFSNADRGFQGAVWLEQCDTWSILKTLTDRVVISSPGYPRMYPAQAHCVHTLKNALTASGYSLLFKAVSFNLQPYPLWGASDALTFRSPNVPSEKFFRGRAGPIMTVDSAEVVATFVSVDWVQQSERQFQIEVSLVWTPPRVCNLTVEFEKRVILASPGYPAFYPNNIQCRYEVVPKFGRLEFPARFRVIDFRTEPSWDRVLINNQGGFDFSGTIATGTTLIDLAPIDGGINVTFESNDWVNEGGFQLELFRLRQSDCDQTIVLNGTGQTAVISSPAYPEAYPNDSECRYHIVNAVEGSAIRFQPIFFETQVDRDFIQFATHNPKGLSKEYTGHLTENLTFKCEEVLALFRSDAEGTAGGFKFEVTLTETVPKTTETSKTSQTSTPTTSWLGSTTGSSESPAPRLLLVVLVAFVRFAFS